jgi:hypothetical protein
MALSPFIRVAGRPAERNVVVIVPDLADPTPPDLDLFAATAIGPAPGPAIEAAKGAVLARADREWLVALPHAAAAAAIAARAGLDDLARVGSLWRGIAIGDVAANSALHQRFGLAGGEK